MDVITGAQDVLKSLERAGTKLPEDVNAAEKIIAEHCRAIAAKGLELHLAKKKLGYEGSSRPCPCGRRQKFVGYRPRTLATTLGSVSFERAYYLCGDCGCSCCPYDQACGLGSAQESAELAQAATLLAVHDPFSPSATILHRLIHQRLSDRTINRLTHRVGKVAAEREKQLALRMATWSVPMPLARPRRLYVAVDGTTVHLQDGWREIKCVTCYWEDEAGNRQARYQARLETVGEFRAFVWALACQCGLESAVEVILLGDGAAWIWDQVAGVLGEKTICITDWYHVTEHVWDCSRELFGESSDAGKKWAQGLETLLWEGRAAEALTQLENDRRQRRGSARLALAGLMTYLSNQGDRLAYDRFRALGMDIGSGRVEAMCKQVGVRMKRSGMCWSDEGAQATLSLRSVWLNGQWDEFWAARPLAA
jgi:hypothetical protein